MTTNNPETQVKVKVGPEWWEWALMAAAVIGLLIAGVSTAMFGMDLVQGLALLVLLLFLCGWPWVRRDAWFPRRGPRP